MKTYITRDEWDVFRDWLINIVGVNQEPLMNKYELLRWTHHLPGKPKPIAFRRDVSDKITLNGEAAKYYDDFRRRQNVRNVHRQ